MFPSLSDSYAFAISITHADIDAIMAMLTYDPTIKAKPVTKTPLIPHRISLKNILALMFLDLTPDMKNGMPKMVAKVMNSDQVSPLLYKAIEPMLDPSPSMLT